MPVYRYSAVGLDFSKSFHFVNYLTSNVFCMLLKSQHTVYKHAEIQEEQSSGPAFIYIAIDFLQELYKAGPTGILLPESHLTLIEHIHIRNFT